MSGGALTMRLVGTLHLLLHLLGCHLTRRNLGAAQGLDELRPIQAGDLSASPLRDQAAAVEMDRHAKTSLPADLLGALAEALQEGIRDVDCDCHRFFLPRSLSQGAAATESDLIVGIHHHPNVDLHQVSKRFGVHSAGTFLLPDDPRWAKFDRLTRQEERAGLLDDTATIGTRTGWTERLRERGYALRRHRLVRSR